MKKLTFAAFGVMMLISPVLASANEPDCNYILNVKMENIPDSVIFTLGENENNDPKYKRKLPIINNTLHYELKIDEDFPIEFYLTARNPKDKNERFIKTFFAGKGMEQTLTADGEGFKVTSNVEGAPWDEAVREFNAVRMDFRDKKMSVQDERRKLGRKESEGVVRIEPTEAPRYKVLTDSLMKLQDEEKAYMMSWIKNHPDVPEAINLMGWRYSDFPHDDVAAFYSQIPDGWREMSCSKLVKSIMETKVIAVGDKLADYDIVGVGADSVAVRLSQFDTPYIIVDFNSLGCGACRMAAKQEIPQLVEKYAGQLTFVSFSVDDEWKRMLRAHKIDKATWPTIWDGKGSSGPVCLKYGVTGYPTFFIFGPDRTLLLKSSGWGPGRIEQLLQEAMKNGK